MRYDACTPRIYKKDGEDKTFWLKVGSAWKNDKGMVTVYLDAYPLPDPNKEGKAVIMLFEPKKKGGQRDDEDEIPF